METCETLVLNILTNECVHCPFTCESFPSDEPKGIVRIWKAAWEKVENEPVIRIGNELLLVNKTKHVKGDQNRFVFPFTGELLNMQGILLDEHEVDVDKFQMENIEEFFKDEGFISFNHRMVYVGKYADKSTYKKCVNGKLSELSFIFLSTVYRIRNWSRNV